MKENSRRRKFPHPLLKCSIFHPKAIPLSQGKYIYVRAFFCGKIGLFFTAFKYISCEQQRWRQRRGLAARSINTLFLGKIDFTKAERARFLRVLPRLAPVKLSEGL